MNVYEKKKKNMILTIMVNILFLEGNIDSNKKQKMITEINNRYHINQKA